ncbi:hypothetical protein ACI2IY_00360 [Lysobacter enzymogenes]|uniref:hypothetical protein n=1 Tax=Lysobacter enzymogenes TaxID=69 RepID=UPI003850F4D3
MLCYRHAPEPALGICRSCGRGVCAQCARDAAGPALACSEECAQRVQRNEALVSNGEAGYRFARRGNVVLATFPLLLGAVLLYFGLVERNRLNAMTAMGAILLLFAAVLWLRQRQLSRQFK